MQLIMPIIFSDKIIVDDFDGIAQGQINRQSIFKIYPITRLAALIQVLRVQVPKRHTILFLVDNGERIWFAGYAPPDPAIETEYHIPMHYQMTGYPAKSASCRTAGVIEMSDDYKLITKISNKSCSFKPTVDSIKWALAILVFCKSILDEQSITLSKELHMEEYSSAVGGFQGTNHILDLEELTPWLERVFADEKPYLIKQPETIKEVTYHPRKHLNSFYLEGKRPKEEEEDKGVSNHTKQAVMSKSQ